MPTYTILAVDDEQAVLDTLRLALEGEGYQVELARSGSESIQTVGTRIIDLAIVDMWMGKDEMRGSELIRILRSKRPYMEFIVLSGHGSKDDAIEAVNQNVAFYLNKPMDIDLLLFKVLKALENRHPILMALEKLAMGKSGNAPCLLMGEHERSAMDIYNEVRMGSVFGLDYAKEFMSSMFLEQVAETDPGEWMEDKGVWE